MAFLRKQRGFWYRAGAGAYSRSGISDIMGTYYGHTVAIEVKTPVSFKTKNYGRTPNQVEFHRMVDANGGFSATVCSVSQVEEFLKLIEDQIAQEHGESYLSELR